MPEPPQPTAGGRRLVRVGMLSGLTVLIAAAAHRTAGGSLSSASVTAAAVPTALMWLALTGRRLRWWRLSASLGVLQFALHCLFCWLNPMDMAAAVVRPAAGGSAADVMGHDGMQVDVLLSRVGGAGHSSAWMLGAHVVATLLVAVALWHGEAALWWVRRVLTPAAPAELRPVSVASPLAVTSRAIHISSRLVVRSRTTRGPPWAARGTVVPIAA